MSSITRRCDYAMRIIRAAYRSGETYISIADVSERESIPYSFARSIQHDLVKAGFVKTIRGVHGGLALACDPTQTTIYDVMNSLEGPVTVADCTKDGYECDRKDCCEYNAVWRAADSLLIGLYSSITLADLFELGEKHPAVVAAQAALPQ